MNYCAFEKNPGISGFHTCGSRVFSNIVVVSVRNEQVLSQRVLNRGN